MKVPILGDKGQTRRLMALGVIAGMMGTLIGVVFAVPDFREVAIGSITAAGMLILGFFFRDEQNNGDEHKLEPGQPGGPDIDARGE